VQRAIEAQRATQRGELVHGGVAGQHGGGRIAAQPQRHEDQRDDAEGDEQRMENLANEVLEHLSFGVARL
jgi:hypothetical protein